MTLPACLIFPLGEEPCCLHYKKVAGKDKSPLPVSDPLSPSVAIEVRRLGSVLKCQV